MFEWMNTLGTWNGSKVVLEGSSYLNSVHVSAGSRWEKQTWVYVMCVCIIFARNLQRTQGKNSL